VGALGVGDVSRAYKWIAFCPFVLAPEITPSSGAPIEKTYQFCKEIGRTIFDSIARRTLYWMSVRRWSQGRGKIVWRFGLEFEDEIYGIRGVVGRFSRGITTGRLGG